MPARAGELPRDALQPLGLVILAEKLRPNVRETVAFLLEMKMRSGEGRYVAMVGDGVNDVPALKSFFELTVPSPGMVTTALLAGSASIGAHALCGYSLRAGPATAPTE